jgi:hypothetical protein
MLEAIILMLIEQVGIPALLKALAPHTNAEEAASIIQAEHDAIRIEADVRAKAIAGGS